MARFRWTGLRKEILKMLIFAMDGKNAVNTDHVVRFSSHDDPCAINAIMDDGANVALGIFKDAETRSQVFVGILNAINSGQKAVGIFARQEEQEEFSAEDFMNPPNEEAEDITDELLGDTEKKDDDYGYEEPED